MATSSPGFHESESSLRPETKDRHRAIVSLMEELEAIDWYDQRIDATGDSELRSILAHNRDEEIEHAMMLLEWLRRRMPGFDERIRTYLFAEGSIVEAEETAEAAEAGNGRAGARGGDGSLGVGGLRGEVGR